MVGKGGKGRGDHRGFEQLVEEVKNRQRTEEGFREEWKSYCMMYGGQKMDPSKHDEAFLRQALAGASGGGGGGGGNSNTAPTPGGKSGGKPSGKSGGKKGGGGGGSGGVAPAGGYSNHGYNTSDHHSTPYSGGGYSAAPAQQQYTSYSEPVQSYGGYGGYGGDSKPRGDRLPNDFDSLVSLVKERQRSLPGWKTAWWHYCDVHGSGDKDPSRHEASFLREALHTLQNDSSQGEDHGGHVSHGGHGHSHGGSHSGHHGHAHGGQQGHGGGGHSASQWSGGPSYSHAEEEERLGLVDEVKERQRHMAGFRHYWIELCQSNGVGGMDPSRHELEFLRRGLLPPQENHQELVDVIKGFQRTQPGFKEEWVEFCNTRGSGVRDPNRHPPEFLAVALRELAGGKGLRGVPARPQGRGGPRGGDEGAPTDGLVDHVKQKQRDSPQTRERWIEYCSRWGSSDLDPARHNADFLQKAMKFMATGIDEGTRTTEVPDLWRRLDDPSISTEALVAAIKKGQRLNLEWRSQWWDYCDQHGNGDHDPYRHDPRFLREAMRALGEPHV